MKFIYLLLFTLFSSTIFAAESQSRLNHDSVQWNRLVYEATAFFITLETEMKLSSLNRQMASDQLVMKDESNLMFPRGEKVFRIETFTDSFGKETRYSLWFDGDGEILQRKKVQRGKKNEIKLYRFSPCAYYSLRKKFPDEEFDENNQQWDAFKNKFHEFSPELCGDEPIIDANALLYLISALNIKDVEFEKDILTFSRGKLIKVRIKAKEKTSIYSEFYVVSPDGKTEIEDDIDVLKIQLSPIVGNSKERDNFRFLGLKGNINIYLDTKRKLIVRLSGKVKVLGSIDINLKKVELGR